MIFLMTFSSLLQLRRLKMSCTKNINQQWKGGFPGKMKAPELLVPFVTVEVVGFTCTGLLELSGVSSRRYSVVKTP